MEDWHGYVLIQRIIANLSEQNWAAVVDLTRQIVVNQASNHPEYTLQERGSLDVFEYSGKIYSNVIIFEGFFKKDVVDFERFKIKMEAALEVDSSTVDYTLGQQTVKDRPSIFATYRYNILNTPQNRMRVALLGCESEDALCTWNESRIEAVQYIIDNGWNE